MKPYNCNKKSAWYTWQKAGYQWRVENPNATCNETKNANDLFALDTAGLGPHSAVYGAKYRAFKEGLQHGQV